MKDFKATTLLAVLILLALVWVRSLAPVLGLGFISLELLIGWWLLERARERNIIWWVVLVGLLLDILSATLIGLHLIALLLALIVWPHLFSRILAEDSIIKLFVKAAGSILVYKLGLVGLTYIIWKLNITQLSPVFDTAFGWQLLLAALITPVIYLLVVKIAGRRLSKATHEL